MRIQKNKLGLSCTQLRSTYLPFTKRLKTSFHVQTYLSLSSIYKNIRVCLPLTKIFELVFHLQKYLSLSSIYKNVWVLSSIYKNIWDCSVYNNSWGCLPFTKLSVRQRSYVVAIVIGIMQYNPINRNINQLTGNINPTTREYNPN